ncbi:hypothetical protein [Carnobacterium maltaromaticum]|uniref:hypothetical protein n=1 Tax=Carnobacterium maltaromaticum TaxID=2751 RepID=UPI0012F903E8|nr:hypothetical protein [Carnobacterium maltaromaticum]
MLIEQRVYRLLNNNLELTSMLDEIRGREFDPSGEIDSGIFTAEIPDLFRKEEDAPFIRINAVSESPGIYADNEATAEFQSVQVDFWCKELSHSLRLRDKIDEILKGAGLTQYFSTRYPDPDIKLNMNVRKYNFLDFDK